MASVEPLSSASVVAFEPRFNSCASLTSWDRMEVHRWREQASTFGYDRLVIHERLAGDPPELGSFLSVYRRGEPWSRFGITRIAGRVLAWCCRTGRDVGRFASVSEALHALLPVEMKPMPCLAASAADNVVRFAFGAS